MLDRVTPAPTRDPIDYIERFKDASGVAVVLGRNQNAVAALAQIEAVTEVVWVCTNVPMALAMKAAMLPEHGGKINHFERSPFGVQRRDIGHQQVGLLFMDCWSDPWHRDRVEQVRAAARELRPMAVNYRWQELDIVAEWLGQGMDASKIDASAIDIFRVTNMVLVGPRTNAYAEECMALATRTMEEGRAAR